MPIEPPGPAPSSAAGAPGAPRDPNEPAFCVGYCFPARIGGLLAAVVIPHVPDYPADKLELVAAVRVRDALGVAPGDRVLVEVEHEASLAQPIVPGQTRQSHESAGTNASCSPLPWERAGVRAPDDATSSASAC